MLLVFQNNFERQRNGFEHVLYKRINKNWDHMKRTLNWSMSSGISRGKIS